MDMKTVQVCLGYVSNLFPEFAGIISLCRLVETTDYPVAAVDKSGRIYINLSGLEGMNTRQVMFVLLHEVLHLILLFFDRLGDKNVLWWNLAQDFVINEMLMSLARDKKSIQWPDKGVLPKDYGLPSNLSDDNYYTLISAKADKGEKIEFEPDVVTEGEGGEGEGDEVDGDLEVLIKMEAPKALASIGNTHKIFGEISASTEKPKISWAVLLRRAIASIEALTGCCADYGPWYRRGDIMHQRIKYTSPRVAVIVDISGSVRPWIADFWAEVSNLFKTAGTLRVLAVDTEVCQDIELKPGQTLPDISLGGGTDLRAGFHALRRDNYDMLIVLTDGETPWPTSYKTKTICILTPGGRNPPGWMRKVEIN